MFKYLVAYVFYANDEFGIGSGIMSSSYSKPTAKEIKAWEKALKEKGNLDIVAIFSFNYLANDEEE